METIQDRVKEWREWEGKLVVKKSGKPFKSGDKIGKVIVTTINLNSGKPGFLIDNESIVDCYQVKLYEDEN